MGTGLIQLNFVFNRTIARKIQAQMAIIYKILRPGEWTAAQAGEFKGSPADIADGFIHFSTLAQVRETAVRHFSQEPELILLAIDTAQLGNGLKWEASRGGQLFPHLYATLRLGDVCAIYRLSLGADSFHQFPDSLGTE